MLGFANLGAISSSITLFDGFTPALNKIERNLNASLTRMRQTSQAVYKAGYDLTRAISVPVGALGVGIVNSARKFEDSFTGIRKTVNGSERDFRNLSEGMKELSKVIPININLLNKIGETAGQLGVKVDDIESFTEVVAKMEVTTDLTADQAAISMARFGDILDVPIEKYSNLGSAIVDLGNNFATFEDEILLFSTRIAGAGKIAGFTSAEVLGISAAFSSVGVPAEAGSSAIQKAIIEITKAVADGTDKVDVFARVSGESAEEFAAEWKEKPAQAFEKFVLGLGKAGDKVFDDLADMGLANIRVVRTFLAAAGAGDRVVETINKSTTAFEKNNALNAEASKRFATFTSKLTLAWNRVRLLGIELGSTFLEALKGILDKLTPVFDKLDQLANKFSEAPQSFKLFVGALVAGLAVLGPLVLVLGAIGLAISGTVAAAGAFVTGISAIVGVLAGPGGIIALVGSAVLVLGIFAASLKEVRTPITKLGIAIKNFLVDSFNKVKDKITEWKAEYPEAIELIVKLAGVVKTGLTKALQFLAEYGLAKVSSLLDKFGTAIDVVLGIVGSSIKDINTVKTAFDDVAAVVSILVTLLSDSLRGALDQVKIGFDIVKTVLETTVPGFKTLESVLKGIADYFERIFNLVKKIASVSIDQIPVLKALSNTFGPGKLTVAATPQFDTKSITGGGIAGLDTIAKAESDRLKKLADEAKKLTSEVADNAIKLEKEFKKEVDGIIESTLTQNQKLVKDTLEQIDKINKAAKAGYISEAEAIEVIRKLRNKLEKEVYGLLQPIEEIDTHLRDLLKPFDEVTKKNKEWDDLLLRTDEYIQQINIHSEDFVSPIDEAIDATIRWGDVASAVLGSISKSLGQMAKGVADLTYSFQQAQNIQGAKYGSGGFLSSNTFAKGTGAGARASGALAGWNMGSAVVDIGRSLGFTLGSKGTSQWGGDLGGNYGDKGAQIGGAIGGGLGGPVWGLVGAAAGAIIGSFIKKGADEAIATINQVGDDLKGNIDKAEGKLGEAMQGLIDGLVGTIDNIESQIGGNIISGKFGFKIRGKLVSVFINGITKRFESMDEAILFATNQVLKSAQFGEGVSENMKKVLSQGNFGSLEALNQAIEIVNQVDYLAEALTTTEFERGLQSAIDGLLGLADAAESLGADAKAVYDTINKNLQDQFDAFKGISQSEEERIRQTADALNNQRNRLEEQLRQKMADLQNTVTVEGFGGIGEKLGQIMAAMGENTGAAVEQLHGLVDSIDLVGSGISDEAKHKIDELAAAIAGLPEAISEADIQEAINRALGGENTQHTDTGHQNRKSEREAIRKLGLPALEGIDKIFADFNEQLKDLHERGRKAGSTTADITAAEERLTEARDKAIKELGKSELAQLSPIEQFRQSVSGISDLIDDLIKNHDKYGIAIGKVNDAIKHFSDTNFASIASELADIIGDEQLIGELRRAAQLERIAFLQLEAQELFDRGVWTKQQLQDIKDLADKAAQAIKDAAEAAKPPVPTLGSGGEGGGHHGPRQGSPPLTTDTWGILDPNELLQRLNPVFYGVFDWAKKFRADIDQLRKSAYEFGLTTKQVDGIIRSVGRNLFADIGSRLAQMVGDNDKLAMFEQIKFKLEVAALQQQIAIVKTLNILTQQEVGILDGLIAEATAFANNPSNFIPGAGGGSTPPSGGNNTNTSTWGWVENPLNHIRRWVENFQQVQNAMDAAFNRLLDIENANKTAMSPLKSRLAEVNKEFHQMQKVLGKNARITDAWVEALKRVAEEFVNQIEDFQQSLLTNSQLSPLRLMDQFQVLMDQFIEVSSNPDNIDQALSLAQQLLNMGLNIFPVGSSSYESLFAFVNSILDDLQQQIIDTVAEEAPPALDPNALLDGLSDLKTQNTIENSKIHQALEKANVKSDNITGVLYQILIQLRQQQSNAPT